MGYEKDRMLQEQEQGWSFRDGVRVCFRCLTDPYLRDYAKAEASGFECSFCGRRSKKEPSTISFNALMEIIGGAIKQYFDQAVNCMGWDGQEGGYQGTTYDPDEVVRDEIPTPTENEELLQAIIDSLDEGPWCDRNPYSLSDVDRYNTSWETFCNTVKHQIRYFFDLGDRKHDEFSEVIPVPKMLDALRDVSDEAGLTEVLPTGTRIFRVRVHRTDEECADWRSLGSPPPEVSASNRMSAAGISVFYGALDMATATAETTANLDAVEPRALTVATWTNTRPLRVLDLSHLPKIPSFYAQVKYERDHLQFLQQFVMSITQPVQHDGREHTEYVPSQIVTEYFRFRYRLPDDTRIDGITYPSAQHAGGRSIVVFASQGDLDRKPSEWAPERVPIMTVDPASIHRIPQ
jgi:hypothetical protein